jgi:hypothetical protein
MIPIRSGCFSSDPNQESQCCIRDLTSYGIAFCDEPGLEDLCSGTFCFFLFRETSDQGRVFFTSGIRAYLVQDGCHGDHLSLTTVEVRAVSPRWTSSRRPARTRSGLRARRSVPARTRSRYSSAGWSRTRQSSRAVSPSGVANIAIINDSSPHTTPPHPTQQLHPT